jgi:hypothetical protein
VERPRRDSPSSCFGWWTALAVVLVFACIPIAPALLSGKILSSADLLAQRDPVFAGPLSGIEGVNPLRFDATYVFEPDLIEARSQLRSGHLPSWMAGVGAGRPLIASQQHALFFPTTWLALVLPVERAVGLILALKIALAAVGMLLFCRSIGLRPPSAVIAALAFSLSAYMHSWLQHPHSNVYVLLPWMLLACGHVVRRDTDRAPGLLLGLLGGLALLGGHPQSAVICIAFTGAYLAFCIKTAKATRAPLRVLAQRLALAVALAVSLGAVAILPLLEATGHAILTERGAPGGPLQQLVSVIAPGYWGSPSGTVATRGPLNFAERSMFIGIAPLVLALAGAVAGRVAVVRFFVAALGVAALLAFRVPVIDAAVAATPVGDYINLQRVLVLLVFSCSVLAAFGFERLIAGDLRARRASLAGAAVLVVGCAVAAVAGARSIRQVLDDLWQGVLGRTPDVAADLGPAALAHAALSAAVMLALLAVLGRPRTRRHTAIAIAIVLLAGVELTGVNHGYYRFLDPNKASIGAPEAVQSLLSSDRLYRFVGQGVLGPNLALRYGLYDARVHDHPLVGRYSRLWTTLVPTSPSFRTEYLNEDEQSRKLLDLFSVRRVLFNAPGVPGGGLRDARRVGRSELTIADNPAALPRAFVATAWEASAGLEDSLERVERADRTLLRQRPVLEGVPPSRGTPAEPVAQAITHYDDERVEISVVAPSGGYLVLTDTFFPGWEATVDGRQAPILPANAAFRAVAVSPGRHVVEFAYRPSSVRTGMGFTLAGVLALGLASIASVRRRRHLIAGLPVPVVPAWLLEGRVFESVRVGLPRMEVRLRKAVGVPTSPATEPASSSGPHEPPREWSSPQGARRARTRGRLAFVAGAAVLGAILGASLHPLPADRFQADAIVVIQPDVPAPGPGSDAQTTYRRSFADAIELPQVAEAAVRAGVAGVDAADVPDRVSVVGEGRSNIVRVRARGVSLPQAVTLADAVAAQAVAFMRRAARSNLVETGLAMSYDFENSDDGWTARTLFSSAVATLGAARGGAETGTGRLSFVCTGKDIGCGPGVAISRPFVPGTQYAARAFVRSDGASRPLRLVLGSAGDDVGVGKPVRLDDSYQQLTVTWTPQRLVGSATLGLQTTEEGRVAASVDRVTVVDPSEVGAVDIAAADRSASLSTDLRARRAAASERYSNVGNAASVGTMDAGTGRWAILGGVVGILAVCSGFALAAAARRSSHQHPDDKPDTQVEPVGSNLTE